MPSRIIGTGTLWLTITIYLAMKMLKLTDKGANHAENAANDH